MMRDRDIRLALHELLRNEHGDDGTLVVDELGLCQGAVRADIAVVNGSLAGFEIKSDRDTLARLPRQIEVYDSVFDFVTLVVGKQHAVGISSRIPRHWGIAVVSEGEAGPCLKRRRRARKNKRVEPLAVARLLWRDEALSILEELGEVRGLRAKPRRELWAALVAALPPVELRAVVRTRLKSREGWRSGRVPSRGGDWSRFSARSSRSPVQSP